MGAVALLAAVAMAPVCVHAQQPADPPGAGAGTALLTDWPKDSLPRLLRDMGRNAPYLLPEIDTLALSYDYVLRDSVSDWTFDLAWRPGDEVLVRGDVKPWRNAPRGTQMVSVELLADVIVNGQRQTDMLVAVDSMTLRPRPDGYRFSVRVANDRVFLDTPAGEARQYLQEGVVLANLRVERMGFSAPGVGPTGEVRSGDARREDPDVAERRPAPDPAPSIYRSRVGILIGWRIGPRPYYVSRSDGNGRDVRPRGDTVGSPSTGDRTGGDRSTGGDRTGRDDQTADAGNDGRRTSGSRGDKDSGDGDRKRSGDDDEEDDDLLVAAAAAAGAVAILAYAGGTVGLYGTGDTPLGLTAGFTRPGGGVHLQAAINDNVLDDQSPERLTVKALGFYDVFESRVQPAVGAGVQAVGRTDTQIRPALSLGLVVTTGPVFFYGGVDLARRTPEVGVAYNFKARKKK